MVDRSPGLPDLDDRLAELAPSKNVAEATSQLFAFATPLAAKARGSSADESNNQKKERADRERETGPLFLLGTFVVSEGCLVQSRLARFRSR
jgi:hypothetical protein